MNTLGLWLPLISIGCIVLLIVCVVRRYYARSGMFQYKDGIATRYIDPIAVWNALQRHPQYISSRHDIAAWNGDSEAKAICVDAARQAFRVAPFFAKGRPGLTERETLDLLFMFYNWIETVKAKHRVFCELAAVYGLDGKRTTPIQHVALYFSRERALYRQGFAIAKGMQASIGRFFKTSMEYQWYLANNDTEDQATFEMQSDQARG